MRILRILRRQKRSKYLFVLLLFGQGIETLPSLIMIAVYPLGNGSGWKDNELRLSINSLRKYTDVSEIWVVGEKPRCEIDFFTISNKPKYNAVPQIVADNLITFISQVNPDKFVLMNDDFYCTRPTSLKKLPLYYDRLILERMSKPGISSKYKYTLEKSIRAKTDLNFGVHFPLPVRKVSIFIDCLKESIKTPNGCSFRNLYGNRVKDIQVIEQRNDLKYCRHMADPSEVLNNEWFSIGDEFLLPHCKAFLNKTFGNI